MYLLVLYASEGILHLWGSP